MGRTSGIRPVILAWAFVAALTGLPYVRAALDPPPGKTFLGFFFFVDDSYHYLSFVQQAEDGAFLFRNKLVLEDHAPALVNLEWWLVGRLSKALGARPVLAYRLFGLGVALGFLAAADLWLRRSGLPDTHRVPALVMVSTGAGLGGLLFLRAGRPLSHCTDLTTGVFPLVGLLGNSHFVAGTALLLWSLWAFLEARGFRGHLRAALLGSTLGLVRPYDMVLLMAIRTATVVAKEPVSAWGRRLLPLLSLLPVVAYNGWVFYRNPAFSFFTKAPYLFPTHADLVWALGPPGLVALAALALDAPNPLARAFRNHLLAWLLMGLLVVAIRPVHFSLQFLVGLGFPLLAFAALGLVRLAPIATLATAGALSSTAMVALAMVLGPNPRWYPPAERLDAALALRATCRLGDLALSPPDIGLYISGLTRCRAYVSHAIAPEYFTRDANARAFYEGMAAPARSSLLDRECIAHVVLPGDPGPTPGAWLGDTTLYRRTALVGAAPSQVSIYLRQGREPCSR